MPKNKPRAFTLKAKGRLIQLKTNCEVSIAATSDTTVQIEKYEAIWDTGATGTVITKKVADDLGLKPTGVITSSHAGGSSLVNTYLINVYLPQGIRIEGVRVIEAVLSGKTEMLIGMDIISLGDFAVTNVNGQSCFSFRIPSVKEIDYVKEGQKPSWLKSSRGNSFKRRKK